MPVLACSIPSFPIALLSRAEPGLADRPLALLAPDERVLAASGPALTAGVTPGQAARVALAYCPALELRPADLPACDAEFDALLTALDDYSDAVEPDGLGHAYLAAPDLDERTALAFCRDMGRRMRREFGIALQPAIGCDSGKFTVHAAARVTRPGAVRVVLGAAERPFLRPLPMRLLPLPDDTQLRLSYLGIRQLGQYADLPPRAVLQQFGKPGQLAQRWAQGRDDRPIVPRQKRPVMTMSMEFDPPLAAAPALLAAARELLTQPLEGLGECFQAAQVLTATRAWAAGGQREDRWPLAVPTADVARLLALLARWEHDEWESPVAGLTLTLSEIRDQTTFQAQLFPDEDVAARRDRADLLARLSVRYGAGRLWQALVQDPLALRVERRARWQEAAA